MRSGISTKAAVVGAVGAVLAAATACSGGAGTGDGVRLVTSVYPLEWLATQIGGEDVLVTNLTEPGVDPHDLELSPRQVGSVSDADVVFYIGGMQPAVDDAVGQQAAGSALDVAGLVELRQVPDDAGGGTDPHMWLDPERMATAAQGLADRLAEADPGNAAAYQANTEAVVAELTGIDDAYATGLAECGQRDLVVSHAAFGYLADNYDLEQIGVTGIESNSEPSPARLAEVARLVEERGVETIFTATLVDPAIAETIASEAGVETAVLDPLEGITDASPGTDYPSVMRANLDALTTALDCS
ncbi:metal ABC transporter substrate-binding protein [Actinorugispora endophytica]|uniref:metal ABC transporter substrate-binding protein n=1 Tax=Actinorugispora endophytica TaxID=1605990 RepID=UPI00105E2185|nr:metal ABC transporter substrate-binding protein [Actinorugispora endophytica]